MFNSFWFALDVNQAAESMMSGTTELTAPTLASAGDDYITEAAADATTEFVQAWNEDLSARMFLSPSRNNVSAEILDAPRLSRTPISPPTSDSDSSPHDDKSVSRFIDDWHGALYSPNRHVSQVGLDGTIRRGNVLVPPRTVHRLRPVNESPTQRPATARAFTTAEDLRMRLLADDPDTWKSPAEWDSARLTGAYIPAPDDEDGDVRALGESLDSLNVILELIDYREATAEDTRCFQGPGKLSGGSLASRTRGAFLQPSPVGNKNFARRHRRTAPISISSGL